jgi:hypothetical protein
MSWRIVSRPCPDLQELVRLLDGDVTENRGAELRAHIAVCSRCAGDLDAQRRLVARLSAPIPGVPSPGAAEGVMRRLDAAAAPAPRSATWRRWMLGGLAAAAAAVAIAFVFPRGEPSSAAFRARGAGVSWANKVGVDLWAVEVQPRKLAPGSMVTPNTAFVASYRNLDAAPAYLLAFAVDAAGEVHWLYPAFDDPGADPQSVRLDPSVAQRVLADSVIPEGLVPGTLRCVFVVSRAPLHVSSIESLAPTDRVLEALRARWPDARIDELRLEVMASTPADR